MQRDLTAADLAGCIGAEECNKLLRIFRTRLGGDDVGLRTIRLRRVEARGHCIPFHVDVSRKTMQVAPNSESDYVGGRLAFVTAAGVKCPARSMGSATIHNREIVHGVTELCAGKRYSLFLLGDNIGGRGGYCPPRIRHSLGYFI